MTHSANHLKPSQTFSTPPDSEASTTTLSSPVDEKRQLASLWTDTGTYPVRPGDNDADGIRPHRSRLPLALYLLSFATPFRSNFEQTQSRKSTWRDTLSHPYTLYVVGTLTAIPAGFAMPSIDLLLGYWTTGMTQNSATDDELIGRGNHVAWMMTAVGVVILGTSWVFPLCFTIASRNLTERLRHTYVASVIVQDSAFFEKIGPGEISTRANKDITAIRTAYGEKLGFLIWSIATIIAALTSSFATAPKLAGFLFATIPLLLLIIGILSWANNVVGVPANNLEGRVSTLVEQILSSVRIVQSFNMGSALLKRFDGELLEQLRKLCAKRSMIRSLEQSSVYFAVFLTYSMAFWFGGIQVRKGLETGRVMTSFFNMLNCLFVLASLVPLITGIADAMISLKEIRRQIEREPFIDVREESGVKLPKAGWAPSFALENVTFAYPSRPTIPALDNVSVRIETGTVSAFVGVCGSGSMIALVGSSGSGKSTIASLLLREYDPETANIPNKSDLVPADEGPQKGLDVEKADPPHEVCVQGTGKIYFAGRDIREYNLRWLRSQVAVVSQNPQLFTATVFENVAAGLTGTDLEYRPDIDGADDAPPEVKERTAKIRELCSEAMQKAQAWQFVSNLPEGMDTMISGGRTGVLSGGQRQRLAIARALVRKPACLILDEATSALDADTEDKVRLMLERELAERGMTTIIIAHRLSTVAKAHRIIVMKGGKIVDQGRYDELMDENRPDPTFRNLAITQRADPAFADYRTPEESIDKKEPAVSKKPYREEPLHLASSEPVLAAASLTCNGRPISADKAAMEYDERHHRPRLPSDRRSTSLTGDAVCDRDCEQPIPPAIQEERGRSIRGFATLVQSQKWLFLIGVSAGILAGTSYPIAGWMTGEVVYSLSDASVRPGTNTWGLWFFVMAVVDLFIFFLNAFCIEVASENVARKLKTDSLQAFIKQEIAFFDEEDSSPGNLTSKVSSHPANVGAASGLITAQVVVTLTTLVSSALVGLILEWRSAIVCLPPVLVLLFTGWINMRMLERYENITSIPTAKSASYVNEITDSIRTVAALGRERETMRVYDIQAKTLPTQNRYLMLGTAGFAVGQAVIVWTAALIFHWLAQRLANGAPVEKVFAVLEAVMMACCIGSRLFTFVGDYGRAINSYKAIWVWLCRNPKYSTYTALESAGKTDTDWATGDIVLDHIEMRYPQRPNHPALKDISLRIGTGKTHAFCGTSGSGKSSILALLQRFYDPSRGTIAFGGVDHRQISLDDLRASMAYVSQDPALFEGTIRWNLALGALDPLSVTEEDIKLACKQAYIWEFIRGLEKGLDTEVGMKGANLSGGQRQRLCIARALIRNPKILLLDEATSALDAESEKAVQIALENASRGRTTITVAHRLSTIKRSDVIHVIEDGCVKETGNHEELLRKRGRYLELVQAQL